MTLSQFIWTLERVLLRASCRKCKYFNYGLGTKRCPIFGRVVSYGNCMYYKRRRK